MNNRLRFGLLLGVLLLLGGAIAVVAFYRADVAERQFHGTLETWISEVESDGWTVRDEAIAASPEMQSKVDELLNFTDGVFKVYSRGADRVSVYVAYWEPGRQTPKEIGRHTPDVCWVKAGWTSEHREVMRGVEVSPGVTIPHTEYREFTANGVKENVVFWHVVGNEIHSYDTGGRPAWHAVISDTLRWGADQKKEQFFVRVSSNMAIDEVLKERFVRAIIARVPGLAK